MKTQDFVVYVDAFPRLVRLAGRSVTRLLRVWVYRSLDEQWVWRSDAEHDELLIELCAGLGTSSRMRKRCTASTLTPFICVCRSNVKSRRQINAVTCRLEKQCWNIVACRELRKQGSCLWVVEDGNGCGERMNCPPPSPRHSFHICVNPHSSQVYVSDPPTIGENLSKHLNVLNRKHGFLIILPAKIY